MAFGDFLIFHHAHRVQKYNDKYKIKKRSKILNSVGVCLQYPILTLEWKTESTNKSFHIKVEIAKLPFPTPALELRF